MKTFLKILLCVVIIAVVVAYPIYVVVVYERSKSPDPISMFPSSGVYVCAEENFTLTIDLSNVTTENEEPTLDKTLERMKVTIEFDEKKYNLTCTMSGGHGTFINPVAPSDILTFKSTKIDSADENFLHFKVSKYVFSEDEFYLKSLTLCSDNQSNIFDGFSELHFTKKVISSCCDSQASRN